MRVLSFSSCFPSSRNPTQGIFVLRRLAALARQVDLEAVHPDGWFPVIRRPGRTAKQEHLCGVLVHHRSFLYFPGILKRFDGRLYASGLRRWVAEYRASHPIDLMDAHFVWPDGVAVSHLAKRLGLPYTVTLRGTINPRYRNPAFRDQIASALRGASAVISVSRQMAKIAAELDVSPERIHIIPNGVDLDVFSPIPRPAARQSVGLDSNRALIVSVGYVIPQKGFTELIEAMTRLPDDVRLVIIGSNCEHGSYARRLRRLIRDRGLTDRVTFAGTQPQETVATYFSAADVSVLASHSEGCPNVVLECLACGTPVVATRVGGAPDMIQPGENGELVAPKDPDQLAKAMRLALNREWSREAIRGTVANRSWDAVAAEVLVVWREVHNRKTADQEVSRPRSGEPADID